MSPDEPVRPTSDPSSGRLAGWKEISAYLQRSVRTVQRWERESGLPVHRYPTPRGEAVYAIAEELDIWMRTVAAAAEEAEAAEAADAEAREAEAARGEVAVGLPAGPIPAAASAGRRPFALRRVHLVLAAAVLLTALVAVWLLRPGSAEGSQPAQVKVVGLDLVAEDASGRMLWKYELPYATAPLTANALIVEDLDGDNHREVVAGISAASAEDAAVLCLEWNGTRRWIRRPDRTGQYGFATMASPWIPLLVRTTNAPGVLPALWASWGNRPYFGAFVERLDVKTGEPEAVYWNAGYITSLVVGVARGRPALMLGACDNEHVSASFTVFDLELKTGSSPAAKPAYVCSNCPPGDPMAHFVFPKTDLGRAVVPDGPLPVHPIIQSGAGLITVGVQQQPAAPGRPDATVLYRFDSDLRIVGAEIVPAYRSLQHELVQQGRLRARSPEEDQRQLFPVLSWEGGRFVEIAGPEKK